MDYKERMLEEYTDLVIRIDRIERFLEKEKQNDVTTEEMAEKCKLMQEQLVIMLNYRNILIARLKIEMR